MFDLTTLDYVYIGVILASTIWASIRGGVYETVATLSWVVAAIVAHLLFHLDFVPGLRMALRHRLIFLKPPD